jgi:hypothetical protein
LMFHVKRVEAMSLVCYGWREVSRRVSHRPLAVWSTKA